MLAPVIVPLAMLALVIVAPAMSAPVIVAFRISAEVIVASWICVEVIVPLAILAPVIVVFAISAPVIVPFKIIAPVTPLALIVPVPQGGVAQPEIVTWALAGRAVPSTPSANAAATIASPRRSLLRAGRLVPTVAVSSSRRNAAR